MDVGCLLSPIFFLYLQNANLKELPEEIQLLVSLTHLDVSFNIVECISEAIFERLADLQYFNAQSNQLKALPHTLAKCTRLEQLRLFKNYLEELPDYIFTSLRHLRILDVSVNRLQRLPDAIFDACGNLEELALRRNRVSILQASIGKLKWLRRLILAGNVLQTIPETINNLANLVNLDLSDNRLTRIPYRAFAGMLALTDLNLSSNQLRELPYMGDLKSLRVLNIERNPISVLPPILATLPELEILEIDLSTTSAINSPPLELCREGLERIKTFLLASLKRSPNPSSLCEARATALNTPAPVAAEPSVDVCDGSTSAADLKPRQFLKVTAEELKEGGLLVDHQSLPLDVLALCAIRLHQEEDKHAVRNLVRKIVTALRRRLGDQKDVASLSLWLSNVVYFSSALKSHRTELKENDTLLQQLVQDVYARLIDSVRSDLSPMIVEAFSDDSNVSPQGSIPFTPSTVSSFNNRSSLREGRMTVRILLDHLSDTIKVLNQNNLPGTIVQHLIHELFRTMDAQLVNGLVLRCTRKMKSIIRRNIDVVDLWCMVNDIHLVECFVFSRSLLEIVSPEVDPSRNSPE
ncbi:hypothetical protein, variant [Spizellomyces punctatus DAOM BR117]|uniref:Dilute domain-containing protein n=1 Tax=Spizellomyces punctatus (strain DAOM BR117) TaxID=645134 RepID=A0A0L0HER3_SPIPD|nr:hypothetical protein, variant [Spizellomyces punctatus DAOM BR117]KNC99955.1 hypothetical protein, variant [Spizellomyces punctatus DAOM BR117]|eukprot:XP_016607995.1 hypothetical protein, variant [Spizellomyces punctatus DAOM BR117]